MEEARLGNITHTTTTPHHYHYPHHITPGLLQREPLLDSDDLHLPATVIPTSIVKPGRDSIWIMAGRTESNVPKVKKLLAKYHIHYEQFTFLYNTKQMLQYGHWSRQRGLNNAKNLEPVFFCWLGNTPIKVIMAVLCRNVPVLGPEHQSMVSVAGMIGTPHDDDAEESQRPIC